METDIRGASESSKQIHLNHEACMCCRFSFPGQMCNLALQKGPETSNPLLRTKDNSLSCGITCVSHEKGDSPGSPPICQTVLWAPPGGHRWSGSLFFASRSSGAGTLVQNKKKYSDLFCFVFMISKKEITDRQEKQQQKMKYLRTKWC